MSLTSNYYDKFYSFIGSTLSYARGMLPHFLQPQVVDSNARHNLSREPVYQTKTLIHRIDSVAISQGIITTGQGDYVIFQRLESGQQCTISREIFDQVYPIFLRHSPYVMMNQSLEESVPEQCAQRYELIRKEVKQIDPSLEVAFVPRTLYELIFIRQSIKEDLKNRSICPYLDLFEHTVVKAEDFATQKDYESFLRQKTQEQTRRKCWHLSFFNGLGGNEDPGVKEVAYRLNQVVAKIFRSSSTGLTYQEFTERTEKEINFLKRYYQKEKDFLTTPSDGKKFHHFYGCPRLLNPRGSSSGPTINFGFTPKTSMGLRDDQDAQIIRKALALDCSEHAKKAFFLYRGCRNFPEDTPYLRSNPDIPYSLSFGTSLFAGCLYDGGATAFHYIQKENTGYAVCIPFEKVKDSPFYIPEAMTIPQLFGFGEIFHGRTKAWKDCLPQDLKGIQSKVCTHQQGHLRSDLSKEQLTTSFQGYKDTAIQLGVRMF